MSKTLKRKTPGELRGHRERERKKRRDGNQCTYGQPADLKRRRRLEKSTEKWLKHYLPDVFPYKFAQIHRDYMADLEYTAVHGGYKAEALPRGSGKTMIALGFALKAILKGDTRYAVIISATGPDAKENLKDLKTWLLHNDRLAADYPEICAPIRHTNGVPQAMKHVQANGKTVNMEWTGERVVLPDCPLITDKGEFPGPAAHAIVETEGMTGQIRGKKYTRIDGPVARPDLAIVDDPQTRDSARSDTQCDFRLSTIRADVARLAGPDKDMRMIVPCTIIERGDLADRITNPEREPDFLGDRYPFFLSLPENWELWEQYNEIRKQGLEDRDGGKAATKFYKDNREAMDKGAEVTWPDRRGDTAISGIQWGMNEYFRMGPKAFGTELQNQPMPDEGLITLQKDDVLGCETDVPKWTIPFNHIATIAFVDLNPRSAGLSWTIVSFAEQLSAHILAYGAYPERGVLVQEGESEAQEDAALFEGLRHVVGNIAEAKITDFNNQPGKIDMLLIDGGYKFSIAQKFASQARMPFPVVVDRGRASSAYNDAGRDVVKAMNYVHHRKNQKGERYLSHNADTLREIAQRAFQAGPGAPGGIGIHKQPPHHEEFAQQITSKILSDKAEGNNGSMMYKWTLKPGGHDHWLDCIVGCYAGAHWQGIESAGTLGARGNGGGKKKKRKRSRQMPI